MTTSSTAEAAQQKTRLTAGFLCGCGAKRDRTADLYNAIVALSPLSYSPVVIHDRRSNRHDR